MKIKKIKEFATEGHEALFFNSKKNMFIMMGEPYEAESVLIVYKTNGCKKNAIYWGSEEFDDLKGVKNKNIKFGCCDKGDTYVLDGVTDINEAFTLIKLSNSPEHYGMIIIYFINDGKSHLAVLPLINQQDFETMRKYVYKFHKTEKETDEEVQRLYQKTINAPTTFKLVEAYEDVEIIFKE